MFVCFQGTWEKKLSERVSNVYRKRKFDDHDSGKSGCYFFELSYVKAGGGEWACNHALAIQMAKFKVLLSVWHAWLKLPCPPLVGRYTLLL